MALNNLLCNSFQVSTFELGINSIILFFTLFGSEPSTILISTPSKLFFLVKSLSPTSEEINATLSLKSRT